MSEVNEITSGGTLVGLHHGTIEAGEAAMRAGEDVALAMFRAHFGAAEYLPGSIAHVAANRWAGALARTVTA